MGEETVKTAPEASASEEVVVVVVNPEVPTTSEKEAAGEVVEAEKPKEVVETASGGGVVVGGEEEMMTEAESAAASGHGESLKEESNVVDELPDPEKKALDELKLLVQEALNSHDLFFFTTSTTTAKPNLPMDEEEEEEEEKPVQLVTAVTELPPPPPPPQPPVETKEEEKVFTAVDDNEEDDGVKTVEETIKEAIVEVVSAPAPTEAKEAPPIPPKEEEAPTSAAPAPIPPLLPEEVSIWGIRLLADDEKSDVILLKFLRARDFKVKDAFSMLKNTLLWRNQFGIDSLLLEEEENETELHKVVFMHGFDKQGHPVCYNAYGEFQNKDLYQNTFSDEDKRLKFLRWRIQFLEKSIRKLDFTPDGISTIVQINDLKNSPGPFKRDLRLATNQALQLLQDNYPEFVAQQVFINVPWWYLAFYKMISPFFTLRTKSKFVFAGPSKSAETLFKYIAPEQVPVQYGGLSREGGEQEFTVADPVTEETIKQTTKHTVEFPFTERCLLVWEVRVVGWEVSYGAEFVPSTEDGYTVIVQKSRKISPADEPIISNNFKIDKPGKVVLTFDNQTSKKKKLLYRSKTKTSD